MDDKALFFGRAAEGGEDARFSKNQGGALFFWWKMQGSLSSQRASRKMKIVHDSTTSLTLLPVRHVADAPSDQKALELESQK